MDTARSRGAADGAQGLGGATSRVVALLVSRSGGAATGATLVIPRELSEALDVCELLLAEGQRQEDGARIQSIERAVHRSPCPQMLCTASMRPRKTCANAFAVA